MDNRKIAGLSPSLWGVIALLIVFLGAGVYVIWGVLSDDSSGRKKHTAIVTLLRPPPPPPVKEKPPEPEPVKEIAKRQEVIDPGPVPKSEAPQRSEADNAPAGDKLGLDAEGTAGGDAFGLIGKKGGRSILAGGDGSGQGVALGGGGGLGKLSLLTKYASYTQLVEAEVRKKVMTRLDENGGIPRGRYQTIARISLDGLGRIIDCRVIGSSGNHKMDETVLSSLGGVRISEPPPDGMPKTMNIRVSSQS